MFIFQRINHDEAFHSKMNPETTSDPFLSGRKYIVYLIFVPSFHFLDYKQRNVTQDRHFYTANNVANVTYFSVLGLYPYKTRYDNQFFKPQKR